MIESLACKLRACSGCPKCCFSMIRYGLPVILLRINLTLMIYCHVGQGDTSLIAGEIVTCSQEFKGILSYYFVKVGTSLIHLIN